MGCQLVDHSVSGWVGWFFGDLVGRWVLRLSVHWCISLSFVRLVSPLFLLVVWWVCYLFDSLLGWLTGWLVGWFIGGFVCWLVVWLVCWLIGCVYLVVQLWVGWWLCWRFGSLLLVGGLIVWWVGCWDGWLKGTPHAEHSTFTAVSPLTLYAFC